MLLRGPSAAGGIPLVPPSSPRDSPWPPSTRRGPLIGAVPLSRPRVQQEAGQLSAQVSLGPADAPAAATPREIK